MRSRERIEYKTSEQIRTMRRAGLVVADIHQAVREAATAGITTEDLNDIAVSVLERHDAISNFYGYRGFPRHICVSVNEEIVHGIPGPLKLRDGDVVSVDCGAIVDGWHADAAISIVLDGASERDEVLDRTTERAMWAGIAAMAKKGELAAVGDAVETIVEEVRDQTGFSHGIVHEYIGHGIGSQMHQPPEVLNTRVKQRRVRVEPGLCVCVEPLLTVGQPTNDVLDDDWTVVTTDGSRAAHWEHTVAFHDDGIWVLTSPDGGATGLAAYGLEVAPLD